MSADKFTIEILEDGTLKVTTDKVSAANHLNAERFIAEMFRSAGGEVTIEHRHGKASHHHHGETMTELEKQTHGAH